MHKNEKNIFLLLWFLILISINSYAIDFISSHKLDFNLNLKSILDGKIIFEQGSWISEFWDDILNRILRWL